MEADIGVKIDTEVKDEKQTRPRGKDKVTHAVCFKIQAKSYIHIYMSLSFQPELMRSTANFVKPTW